MKNKDYGFFGMLKEVSLNQVLGDVDIVGDDVFAAATLPSPVSPFPISPGPAVLPGIAPSPTSPAVVMPGTLPAPKS